LWYGRERLIRLLQCQCRGIAFGHAAAEVGSCEVLARFLADWGVGPVVQRGLSIVELVLQGRSWVGCDAWSVLSLLDSLGELMSSLTLKLSWAVFEMVLLLKIPFAFEVACQCCLLAVLLSPFVGPLAAAELLRAVVLSCEIGVELFSRRQRCSRWCWWWTWRSWWHLMKMVRWMSFCVFRVRAR